MKYKIALTRSLLTQVEQRLREIEQFEIVKWEEDTLIPRDELLKLVQDVDGIICLLNDRIDHEVMDVAGKNLKVVSTFSVGTDHIDLEEARKRGVKVGYTPDVLTEATSDLAIALMLMSCRRLLEANQAIHQNQWIISPTWMLGNQPYCKTIGIIGFGRIGQAVARKVSSFLPKKILVSRRSSSPATSSTLYGIDMEFTDFETLLKESDIIFICCSLNPSTFQLFNKKTFQLMKPNSYLINIARGSIIQQDDLIEALKENRLAGYGTDVTTPEPLPSDHPLLSFKNVTVLPHIGSAAVETRNNMGFISINNLLKALGFAEDFQAFDGNLSFHFK